MSDLQRAFQKITSSPYYLQMKKFAEPLERFLGINHFWYYKISNTGNYSYIGSHTAWSEYCISQNMLFSFECLRHPSVLQPGLSLMKTDDKEFKNVLETAWTKFQINFHVNLISKNEEGVEAFGFASGLNDAKSDERLLNQLPLLKLFIKSFKEEYAKLFLLLEENQTNISTCLGQRFFENNREVSFPYSREDFLKRLGYGEIFTLSKREMAILKLAVEGYPASHIADELSLSIRTIEHYMEKIKDKLLCNSKLQLIQKAKALLAEI